MNRKLTATLATLAILATTTTAHATTATTAAADGLFFGARAGQTVVLTIGRSFDDETDGCIVIPDDIDWARVDYSNDMWTIDGFVIGTSVEEDSCILPI